MKSRNVSNMLLVELLIVIFFFMLASTVLLQVFAAARNQSAKAELLSVASVEAQNLAEQLYAADSAEVLLHSLGFSESGGKWTLEKDMFTTDVILLKEPAESGNFLRRRIVIRSEDNILIDLPCSRYEEVDR